MNWLTRLIPSIMTSKSKSKVPDGLWSSCPSCESVLYAPDLEKSLFVCPKCDHHLRIGARKRLEIFLDNGYFEEIAADIKTKDSLKFKDTKNYSLIYKIPVIVKSNGMNINTANITSPFNFSANVYSSLLIFIPPK